MLFFPLYCFRQVIGAKKGGKTTKQLAKQNSLETLKQIKNNIGIPIKFLHVVRNPFDNIATMLLVAMKQRRAIGTDKAVSTYVALWFY